MKAVEPASPLNFSMPSIVDLPRAGAKVPRLPTSLPVRRIPVKRFPYHVVYLEESAAIRVLALAHDRRKPGYWKSRLP